MSASSYQPTQRYSHNTIIVTTIWANVVVGIKSRTRLREKHTVVKMMWESYGHPFQCHDIGTKHKNDVFSHTLVSVVAFSFQFQDKICYSFSFCYILVMARCVFGYIDWTTRNHVCINLNNPRYCFNPATCYHFSSATDRFSSFSVIPRRRTLFAIYFSS